MGNVLVNVYNHYDECKRVIARVRVDENKPTITEETYKRVLKKRIFRGDAGVYTEKGNVSVIDKYGNTLFEF